MVERLSKLSIEFSACILSEALIEFCLVTNCLLEDLLLLVLIFSVCISKSKVSGFSGITIGGGGGGGGSFESAYTLSNMYSDFPG